MIKEDTSKKAKLKSIFDVILMLKNSDNFRGILRQKYMYSILFPTNVPCVSVEINVG